jgi:hypothetical protein
MVGGTFYDSACTDCLGAYLASEMAAVLCQNPPCKVAGKESLFSFTPAERLPGAVWLRSVNPRPTLDMLRKNLLLGN